MLWRSESVQSQGLDEMDGASAPSEEALELAVKFQTTILLPLMGRAVVAPEEVQALIEMMRDKLDTLASLIPNGPAVAFASGVTGPAQRGAPGVTPVPEVASDADDIGRNQRSRVREMVLLAIWAVALVGVLMKSLTLPPEWLSISFYVLMGWFGVFLLPQVIQRFPIPAIVFMVLGGLMYTFGVPFYASQKPKKGLVGAHEIWHGFVLAGSISHFVMMMNLQVL